MKDKEKQIEEMSKEIFNTCAWRFGNPNDYKEVFNDIAEDLTKLNYRKLPEDSVVLSREELNEIINQTKETEKNYYKRVVIPQERKETAEKIFVEVLDCESLKVIRDMGWETIFNDINKEILELAKQFGVEIKE